MITGIHGVGKNYVLNQIIEKVNLNYYDASTLIKSECGMSDENKEVKDVDENQKILINSVRKNIKEKVAILNGHLCIINKNKEIQKINIKVLQELNLVGLILITDEVPNIVSRIKRRDGISWDNVFVDKLQSLEQEYSFEISNKLNIPLYIFQNGDSLTKIIEKIIEIKEEYNGK